MYDTSVTPPVVSSTQFYGLNGALVAAPAVFAQGSCSGSDNEFEVLCDISTTPPTPYLRRAVVDSVGVVTWSNVNITTGAVYVPVTPSVCDGWSVEVSDICALNTTTLAVTPVRSAQVYRYNVAVGGPVLSDAVTGVAVVLSATLIAAPCGAINVEQEVLCDATPTTFIRRYATVGGVQVGSQNLALDGLVPFVPVGVVGKCVDLTVDEEYVCFSIAGVVVPGRVTTVTRGSTVISQTYVRTDTYVVVPSNTQVVLCIPPTTAVTRIPGGQRVVGPVTVAIPNGRNSWNVYVECGAAVVCPPSVVLPANAVTLTGGGFVGSYPLWQGQTHNWSIDEASVDLLGGTVTLNVPAGASVQFSWLS
jgi:hypothetical protein